MSYTRKAYPAEHYDHGREGVPPIILIDAPEDDMIESQAWVEVCEECLCPEQAQAYIERAYPITDREELDEQYEASGQQVWLRPLDHPDTEEQRWEKAEPGPDARKFWTVRVTCPI